MSQVLKQGLPIAPKSQPAVRLRPIALPSEHGGWGMLGAPILAAMLAAPAWPGVLLSIAGVFAFLTRQPLRLALGDARKGKRFPRTTWAFRFAVGYATLGAGALAIALSNGAGIWVPLAVGAIVGGIQFLHDLEGKGRALLPEVCGAAALSTLGVAASMAGGLTPSKSWILGAILAFQFVSAISYASARVRLARGAAANRGLAYGAHLLALVVVGLLVAIGAIGWPVLMVFG